MEYFVLFLFALFGAGGVVMTVYLLGVVCMIWYGNYCQICRLFGADRTLAGR